MDHAQRKQGSVDEFRSAEYVVFCNQPYGEEGEYESFWHEADVLLLAAAREVHSGKLTSAGARKLLEPYREVLPVLYTGEQRMIYDPRREWWSRPGLFPSTDEVRQNPPASAIFWYKADDLGIPGVGFAMWATPHPIFEVRADAMRPLRETVAGEYRIVVRGDVDDYAAPDRGVGQAKELIEEAR